VATRRELQAALEGVPEDRLHAINARLHKLEPGQPGRDNLIKAMLDAADGNPGYRFRLHRELDLPTDDERMMEFTERSTNAVERSAEAAAESSRSARSSRRAAWLSAIGTAFAAIAAIVTIWLSHCRPDA